MAGQRIIYRADAPIHSTDNSLFLSRSSPSFMGSRSVFSFEDVNCGKRSERPVFGSFGNNNDDEEYDEYFHNPEKKRRLGIDQVQFLEKSFEIDNKLEPERKIKLAKDLGLQPRQVAIWFQNRRARWKSKQLEKDYDALQSSYNSLKADYEGLIKEKEKLNAEVLHLNDKLLLQQKESIDSDQSNTKKPPKSPSQEPNDQSISGGEDLENPDVGYNKLEDISSDKSYILDSESPRYTDGGHSSLVEAGDASYEEDNFSKNISTPSPYVFPKIEDNNYPNPTTYSGYYGFPINDQALEFWSY